MKSYQEHQEVILKKAIEKAVLNGYKPAGREIESVQYDNGLFVFLKEGGYSGLNPTEVIFSHDFSKAFWGDEETSRGIKGGSNCCGCSGDIYQEGRSWEIHLQQMVLEEDPIKYLEKFL